MGFDMVGLFFTLQVTDIKNPNTGMRNLYGKMSVRV